MNVFDGPNIQDDCHPYLCVQAGRQAASKCCHWLKGLLFNLISYTGLIPVMCLLSSGALAAHSFSLPESEDFIYPGEEIVDVVIGPALETTLQVLPSSCWHGAAASCWGPNAVKPAAKGSSGKLKPSDPPPE